MNEYDGFPTADERLKIKIVKAQMDKTEAEIRLMKAKNNLLKREISLRRSESQLQEYLHRNTIQPKEKE